MRYRRHIGAMMMMITLAVTLNSCIFEDLAECVQPYQIIYRTQLITNEDIELLTQLHETPLEEELAVRLKDELKDLFTFEETTDRVVETVMPDLQLCFYKDSTADDFTQPEITYYLIDSVGKSSEEITSDLQIMLPYWHAALCGVEANRRYNGPVSGLSHFGREHATTLALYQPEAAVAYSHNHSVYTGRVHIPTNMEERTYYCNMYQVNSAVAAVIDPDMVTYDSIVAYIAGVADRFDVQDSLFTRNNEGLRILCNRLENTGSKLECLWGACLPCATPVTLAPTPAPASRALAEDKEDGFDFIIEVHRYDVLNNRTMVLRSTCHVAKPLLAAELRVLKFRLKGEGQAECVNAEVTVSVDLEWHSGLGFDDITLL
ncbi:MAG: hypothetical protein MJZ89_04895 [Paludibacteraceae bacterium]|nr:hypothetical protein [Paludibacteraceae bacterium]